MYFVFAFESYYPSGGMSDCVLKTHDRDEALRAGQTNESRYVHVMDGSTGEIIWDKY